MTDVTTPPPVKLEAPTLPAKAPAPWTCKCEAYALPLKLKGPLPEGAYDPIDAIEPKSSDEEYTGGFGTILIVRYSYTPAGPYEELILIPGNYNTPGGKQKGKERLRISRIYVSQPATTYNGRRNWGIPKHIARFEFSSDPVTEGAPLPSELTVKVYPHGSDKDAKPFFSASLRPSKWLPSFPMNTKYSPLYPYLAQPPLAKSDTDPIIVGTDRWFGVPLSSKAKRARIMSAIVEEPPEEAKKHWPNVKPFSVGLWLEDVTLIFPESEEWK